MPEEVCRAKTPKCSCRNLKAVFVAAEPWRSRTGIAVRKGKPIAGSQPKKCSCRNTSLNCQAIEGTMIEPKMRRRGHASQAKLTKCSCRNTVENYTNREILSSCEFIG